MSASGASLPDPNWPRQDPTRPDLPSLPPDPLLDAGAFIDSSSGAAARAHGGDPHRTPKKPEPPASASVARRSPLPAEPPNGKSPPPDAPAPGNGDSSGAKPSPKSVPSERPNWLPPGWVVQDRVRASGATAGTVDKYYFDPNSGRRFRSKIEVLYFLETGTLKKRKKDSMSADGSEEPKPKKSSSAKSAALNFDFCNVPETVEWVLTDPAKEVWTPYIDNEKVPESTKREWVGAFQLLGRSKV